MNLTYTYWNAKEGGYIGFINQFPDYWTQGDSIEELESMLVSLYDDIMQFDDIQSAVPEHTGQLEEEFYHEPHKPLELML